MKLRFAATLIALLLLLSNLPGISAETNSVSSELRALVTKVTDKLKEGKNTEKDLADELNEFDALLAKHRGEKTDEVAQILLMKATLYLEVLDDPDKGTALAKQIQNDFPNTKAARTAAGILESIQKQEEARKIAAALAPGTAFPDFDEKDLAGKPLSIANYKGKVVLIDFWATWCGPCVNELPNVKKTYEKYHPKGLEIIGISLDQDESKLKSFIARQNVPWQQFFDGKGWENKLAAKYGIVSIPSTYLLSGDGKIIGKDLRGERLEQAVADALAKASK